MTLRGAPVIILLCIYTTIATMEQQTPDMPPVLPATAAAITSQAQEQYSPIMLISKQQSTSRERSFYTVSSNAIHFSNFLKTLIPFEMRRQRVDKACQLEPIEIDYTPNQIAFIAAILNFLPYVLLPYELRKQSIGDLIIECASRNNISFTESIELIDFFDIPIAYDTLMSIRQPMPLPINQSEVIDYNNLLVAVFTMAQSHDDNRLWQLFGRMLYPRCDKYPEIAEIIAFISAQKNIEQLVLGAYMQQHLELYKHYIKKFTEQRPYVSFFILSHDGKTLVFQNDNNTIRLYNLVNGSSQRLKGPMARVSSFDFNADDSTLAAGFLDNTIRLWNVADGSSHELIDHIAPVASVAFSPDSRTLTSVSTDGVIRLWNLTNGSSERSHIFQAYISPEYININSRIFFTNSGSTLELASIDGTIQQWGYLSLHDALQAPINQPKKANLLSKIIKALSCF